MLRKEETPAYRILNGSENMQSQVPKFWNIVDLNDDEAEITMYGEVVSRRPVDWWTGEPIDGLFISPEGFLDDLSQIKNKGKVTVRINSVGGDLYTALGICNRLKELNGETCAVIDGIAASAATIIAMGCKTRQIAPGALFMVHEALLELYGNYNNKALMEVNKRLEAANKSAAETYDSATKLGIDNIRNIMAKETWYTGREAVENGFCTELINDSEPSMCMSSINHTIVVNGIQHSIKGFHNMPGNIPVINSVQPLVSVQQVANVATNKNEGNKNSKGGNCKMTVEELRSQHPELIAQIETSMQETATREAIQNERARMREIDEISCTIGNTELIEEAKYGDKACTAQELAFKAIQQQAKLGTAHLQNLSSDFKLSGAGNVLNLPNEGNPTPPVTGGKSDEMQQIVDMAAMIANGGKVPETK